MNSLYARAWYSKALALLNLKNQIGSEKNFEKALEAFDDVLEVNPQDSIAWQYRGNTLPLPGPAGRSSCKLLKRLFVLTLIIYLPVTLRGLHLDT